MPETIRGLNDPLLQSYTEDFSPNQGYEFTEDFSGLSYAKMQSKKADYVNSGIACRLTYRHGVSSLETHDSTQQYTMDTWQIVGNELSRDGFSHPTVQAIATDDQVASIRTGIDNLAVGDTIASIFTDPIFSGISPTNKIILGRFVGLHLRGSTDYRRAQYVLRHTTNAPNRWASNVADIGVDKIYTQAQLLTEVQNAGLWVYPLPARLVYKISNIPTPFAQANYLWGWLKSGSTETTAANNRISIETEYCLEMWTTDEYEPY